MINPEMNVHEPKLKSTLITVAFLQESLSITTLKKTKKNRGFIQNHITIKSSYNNKKEKKKKVEIYLGGFILLISFSYSLSISCEKLILTSVIKKFPKKISEF